MHRELFLQVIDHSPLSSKTTILARGAKCGVRVGLRSNRTENAWNFALVFVISLCSQVPGLIELVIPGRHEELHVVVSVLSAVDRARARIDFTVSVVERISNAGGERRLGAFRPGRYIVPGR